MSLVDEPILNLEQARKYFLAMGCSHFHLERENFDRRDEYYSLNISPSLEEEWRKEEFERQLAAFPTLETIGSSYHNLNYLAVSNNFFLRKMLSLTNKTHQSIPSNDIATFLICIVGNNGLITHGGLIEKAFTIDRPDWAQEFIQIAKSLIKRADYENIPLEFIRGYLLDVIQHYKIHEDPDFLNVLRSKNHSENFAYYKEGANEGNIFAMRMLGKHYLEGLGCEINTDQAKFWLGKAASLGNELAKKELKQLK